MRIHGTDRDTKVSRNLLGALVLADAPIDRGLLNGQHLDRLRIRRSLHVAWQPAEDVADHGRARAMLAVGHRFDRSAYLVAGIVLEQVSLHAELERRVEH